MSNVAMKFRIKDEEHSKAIQEKLFSLGYKWFSNPANEYLYTDNQCLFGEEDGYITRTVYLDHSFETHQNEEYIMLDGEFVPAGSVAVVDGPVTSDGSSSAYYKLRITNRKGETIECETGDILRALVGNDFDLSNIVKACRRAYEASQGRGKQGASIAYDMKKVEYFAQEFAHWHKD